MRIPEFMQISRRSKCEDVCSVSGSQIILTSNKIFEIRTMGKDFACLFWKFHRYDFDAYTVSGDGSHEHNKRSCGFLENAVFDEMHNCSLRKCVFYSLVNTLRKLQIYDFCFLLLFCFLFFLMVLACINYITSSPRMFTNYEFRYAGCRSPM